MTSSLEAAIAYRNDGFNVIPVGIDKRPLVKWEAFQKEFPQIDLIHEWWGKWPNAGIGIITGEVSGCCVIDVDVKDGKPGMMEIAKLLPDGYTVHATTPSGGCHLYFKNCNGTGNRVEFRPGLDFRGEGGYVVAPASPGYKPVAALRREGLEPIPDSVYAALGSNVCSFSNVIDNIPYSFNNLVSSTRINCEDRANSEKNRQNSTTTYDSAECDKDQSSTSDHSLSTSRHGCPQNSQCPQCPQDPQMSTLFIKGRRDNDLFHIANVLAKGGMPKEEILQYVYFCGKRCYPPFSDKEIFAKVDSALKRENGRTKNISADVKDFVLSTCGIFSIADTCSGLNIIDRRERKSASMALTRLVEERVIERVGSKNGMFRKINNDAPKIDIFAARPSLLKIKYPLGIDEVCQTMQKNIIVVAGTQNAGKTAFLLRFCAMNMNRELEIRYQSSEMGQQELRKRLDDFHDIKLEDWKYVDFREVSSGFQDYILPDGINIIDYLEVTDNFWLVGEEMRKIYDKLKTGIAIIALQKDAKAEFGRGGSFSNEKPRIYLTLTSNPPNGGIAKLMKVKNPVDPLDHPEKKQCEFKIRYGSEVRQISNWRHVEGQ